MCKLLVHRCYWRSLSSVAELRKQAENEPNTIMRMRKEQDVTLQVLRRKGVTLKVDFGDIVKYTADKPVLKNEF